MTSERLKALEEFLRPLCPGGIALAFSGGVDSTLLLAVLSRIRREKPFPLLALTACSDLLGEGEAPAAAALAARYCVPHEILRCKVLEIPEVRNNDPLRCYFCKKALFSAIFRRAGEMGLNNVLEGSHADDLKSYRPGRKALRELGAVSPLLQAGLTKEDIRALARELVLPVAEKPAAPCLATRFDYGTLLTPEKLKQAGAGESVLREFLPANAPFRLRVHGDLARIEAEPRSFGVLLDARELIVKKLTGLGFRRVTLDLAGFRSGSFDDRFEEGDAGNV